MGGFQWWLVCPILWALMCLILWAGDAVWWHRSGSVNIASGTCLLPDAPTQYLKYCEFIIHEVQWQSNEGNFTSHRSSTTTISMHFFFLAKIAFQPPGVSGLIMIMIATMTRTIMVTTTIARSTRFTVSITAHYTFCIETTSISGLKKRRSVYVILLKSNQSRDFTGFTTSKILRWHGTNQIYIHMIQSHYYD